jgi:hypothetical protein
MSEIDALINIAGVIDTVAASVEDEDQRTQIMNLVPAYRVGDRFGWYREFREGRWYSEFIDGQAKEGRDIEPLPTLEDLAEEERLVEVVRRALRSLAEPTRFASMLPRRLLAVAVVARIFSEQFGPGREDEALVLDALIVPGIIRGLSPVPTPPPPRPPETPRRDDPDLRNRARALLAALGDRAQLERIEDWHEFLNSHADFLSAQVASLPPPCATTVIEQPVAGGEAIALLQTELCVGGVDLGKVATGVLDPTHWPQCCAWWCKMLEAHSNAVNPPLRRYLEVVADHCPDSSFFEVAVFLDVAKPIDLPTRKVLTYNISTDRSGVVDGRKDDHEVDVDRGVIEVRQDAGHVHVSTSKRIRFTHPDWIGVLAMWACWLGYGDVATDMICNCSGGRPQWVDCDVATPFAGAYRRFVELAYSCLSDAGEEARRVTDRLGSGVYGPEAAASDVTRMMRLAVQGWGKLSTTFVDAVGDVVRWPTPASQLAPPRQTEQCSFDRALAVGCSLSLAGPLRSPYGDVIDTGRVVIDPHGLGPGGREFRLVVNAAGLEGSVYLGEVVATSTATGTEIDRVKVDVIVP